VHYVDLVTIRDLITAMILFAPVFAACWIAVRLSGPGKVISVMKCPECGWSVTAPKEET